MFKSQYVIIDELGINIQKNYSTKEHIDYINIERFEIRNSRNTRYRFLVFSVGLLITLIFSSLLINVSTKYSINLNDIRATKGLIILWITLISLISLGVSLIISVFVKRMTLFLYGERIKTKLIDIEYFKKRKQIKEIENFLKQRVDYYNDLAKTISRIKDE